METEVPVTRGRDGPPGKWPLAEEALARAVRKRVFPGAAFSAGTSTGISWIAGVGRLDYAGGTPTGPSTLYDLASLTKVVATTTVVARLVESGRLDLAARLCDILPGFRGEGRESVTLEHLLTHSSGLPAWRPLFREAKGREEALALVLGTPLESPPGAVERYSDLGIILLGECAARAAAKPLAALSWELVLGPLHMRDTCFRPPASERRRIAPTEDDRSFRQRLIHGEVHDENAWALGGVAGHAGLFSSAEDMGRFGVEVLADLRGLPGLRLLQPETARRFTSRRGIVPGSSRALGWDTRADEEDGSGPPGSRSTSGGKWSPGSFGHTGFTGTSIWLDPVRDRFAVLLSNRVHPGRAGEGMLRVRRDFHDAVHDAMESLESSNPTSARLERAIRDLADAWFLIEEDGRPLGYHRLAVRRAGDGSVVATDEMAFLSRSGRMSFHTEVTTGLDLLSPRRARCKTRLGADPGPPAMEGTIDFADDTITLAAQVFVDDRGVRLAQPRSHRGTEKRPAGPILFQSLVPLLLASLPDEEDGSSLGELVLAEVPAEVDRLVAWKRDRRLSISRTEGGGRRAAALHKGEMGLTAVVRFGAGGRPEGGIERIELERFVERRSSSEAVRRLFPEAPGGGK